VGLLEHRSHNSINRLTGTTGSEGGFAPYQCEDICWPPGAELVVFVLVDEAALDAESLETGLSRIGDFGFGRDAGSGCGRFEVLGVEEVDIPDRTGANACYTLAPSVPETGLYRRKFFTPFIRFGRHGDRLARSRNPFKAPVVMADEGAVFIPKDSGPLSRSWLGRAVKGLSLAQPEAVGQGYTIYLPCEVAV
jgi:CRISPR-associated protein Csm4